MVGVVPLNIPGLNLESRFSVFPVGAYEGNEQDETNDLSLVKEKIIRYDRNEERCPLR
jgi:hypothetical protein